MWQGNYNVAFGYQTGTSYTGAESSNILIQNTGVNGESHVMRLGTSGAGNGEINTTFISGIYGVTPAGVSHQPLVMDSVGQIGTQAQLAVAQGGTGAATFTDHGVLVGSGTAAIDALAVGATGTLLVGVTGADPAFGTSATGDFTFTSATAAQNRALTVSNTDATAANYSAAHLEITTQAASTGDPYIRLNVNSGLNYSIGIDNSDSDSLKITNSTDPSTGTMLWRMHDSGAQTIPLQPSFCAYKATTDSSVTGDGTAYYLGDTSTGTTLTELVDRGADFTPGAAGGAVFTSPVNGIYQVNMFVFCQNGNTSHTYSMGCVVSGTSAMTYRYGNYAAGQPAGNFPMSWSMLIPMTATDTLKFFVAVSASTKTVNLYGASNDPRTVVSGFLVA